MTSHTKHGAEHAAEHQADSHDHAHGEENAHAHAPPAKDEKIHSYYQLLGLALKELLIEKKIVTGEEIRHAIEGRDAITPALGAKVVARAWLDPSYKERLLANGHDAVKELGIEPGALNLSVVENTPRTHNVIVCTLCSCYPRNVLGLPPSWYKSHEYRSRVVREPRAVLSEFGTLLSDQVEVVVHDSTADLRYLVLPMRPEGTEKLNEDELAALVSRDCMIGVSVVNA
jgi:nitrile hydratase subunit alpha